MSHDFRDLLAEFNAQGVEFLIVGAHALAAHGCVRATKDLDVWIRPELENAKINHGSDQCSMPNAQFSSQGRGAKLNYAEAGKDLNKTGVWLRMNVSVPIKTARTRSAVFPSG